MDFRERAWFLKPVGIPYTCAIHGPFRYIPQRANRYIRHIGYRWGYVHFEKQGPRWARFWGHDRCKGSAKHFKPNEHIHANRNSHECEEQTNHQINNQHYTHPHFSQQSWKWTMSGFEYHPLAKTPQGGMEVSIVS